MQLHPESAETTAFLQRFSGIARLYGHKALDTFSRSHVAVVGIGGVGSWAAESLARSGIGRLTLIDLDDICISNTNRQIHTLSGTVGQTKVEVMQARLQLINPDCQVEAKLSFLTAANIEAMLEGVDYVVDAIDTMKHKCDLLAYCQRRKIRIITAGAAGGLTDPTQIRCMDLSRTYHDALLAKVRRNLRQHYGFPTNPKRRFSIEAVFSEEQPMFPANDGEVCSTRPTDSASLRLDCSGGYGAATHVTGTFGFVTASRVLRRLADSTAATD